MCTAHAIWYMVTHYIGPCGCLQVSNWLNSVGYKAEMVKKWHVENVTDHFFLLLFFFWRISEEPEWSKGTPYLLTPGGDGLNKVQGYWLQWWWTGLAGNPDRSRAFLGFEWQWRDSSPGVPGLRRCRTPTSHWPSGGQQRSSISGSSDDRDPSKSSRGECF